MSRSAPPPLSRRERQIMDVVYHLGCATSLEVHERLEDAPTHTTVRGLLRVLEAKGHLRHEEDGPRFVYYPSTQPDEAGGSHLSHVIRTFFDGSPSRAVAALIGRGEVASGAELDRIAALIERARRGAGEEGP
ncbi:MAG TPA: BlaI/MecI/CopY family transcriptional regulator [Longimicrobium sp.]|uniref:BlaI/MecI/CopY family transcriptional regulator n=1 Tax=Longimicrobium sp. TaxID=2029185 RepID=UPI002ED95C52